MKLNDEIIDESEQLAERFPDLTDTEVVEHVSSIVNIDLHPNSIGARLAVASYDRYANLQTG